MLSLSTYMFGKFPDLSPLGLESMQVQIHMELIIFVGPILGHEDFFYLFLYLLT
jgi:hypothetical protein